MARRHTKKGHGPEADTTTNGPVAGGAAGDDVSGEDLVEVLDADEADAAQRSASATGAAGSKGAGGSTGSPGSTDSAGSTSTAGSTGTAASDVASVSDQDRSAADAEEGADFDGFEDGIVHAGPAQRRAAAAEPSKRRRPDKARSRRTSDDKGAASVDPRVKDTSPETAERADRARKAEANRAARADRRRAAAAAPNPAWLAPTAVTLLILGLIYLVTYYLSATQYPLPIGDWNLAVGFALLIAGGGLLMRWK